MSYAIFYGAMTIAVLAGWLINPAVAANTYAEMRSAAVKQCEVIDRSDYQTGLALNPDGYRSYYARSACFQRAAVQFRDDSLCRQVRERWSLFSSSWGYSGKNCRKLVAEGAAADRAALEQKKSRYLAGAVKLRDFRIVRNGNGRDFDIIPSFEPGYDHGYTLRFELIGTGATEAVVTIATYGSYLRGNDNIRIFVPQTDIRQRFPRFKLGQPYQVRATLVLAIGFGGQSGMLSDAFIESVFPVAARSQAVTREITF